MVNVLIIVHKNVYTIGFGEIKIRLSEYFELGKGAQKKVKKKN